MPKLSDEKIVEFKSFLDSLVDNGTRGANADTEEERTEVVQEYMNTTTEVPTEFIEAAFAIFSGFAITLQLELAVRQKQAAN